MYKVCFLYMYKISEDEQEIPNIDLFNQSATTSMQVEKIKTQD